MPEDEPPAGQPENAAETQRVPLSRRLLAINSLSSVLSQLISLTVLVWLHSYLIDRIPAEEYSTYFLVTAIMAFTPLISAVLTTGQSRFIMEAYARGRDEEITEITSTLFPLVTAVGFALFLGGAFAGHFAEHLLTIPDESRTDVGWMLFLALGLFALQLILSPFGSGLAVRQQFVKYNLVVLGGEVLRITLLFALLFGVSTRVLWVVAAQVGAGTVTLFVTVYLSMRAVPALRFRRSQVRWARLPELTSFGSWFLLITLSSKISTSIAVFVFNKLQLPQQVNAFSLAALPHRRLQFFEQTATRPLAPVLTRMHALGEENRLRQSYLGIGRLALWVVLFGIAPALVFRDKLVELWLGPTDLPIAPAMACLLLCFPLQYGNLLLVRIATAKNKVRSLALRSLLVQAIHVALVITLVGPYGQGATGAALALLGATLAGEALLLVPFALRLTHTPFSTWLRETLLPGLLPALVSVAAMETLRRLIVPETIGRDIAIAAAGSLLYLAALYVCLRPSDRDFLRSALLRFRRNASPS